MVAIAEETAEFRVDDDTWTAQWIVLDAGAQAARLRRQASAQTAAICEAAEREAEKIRRQASMQAAAIHEAAEREAVELRARVTKLAAGSGDGHGGAATIAAPPLRPAARPVAPGRANTKGRQARAMRKVTAAFVVLSLTGVTTGAVELTLHGFSFFLFRNTAAGAGNSQNLTEDQGPGQPDAPGSHHRAVNPDVHSQKSLRGSAAHAK
jgi:hypothetical protein